ncbi:hypothetical protein KTR66_20335 [Roseococcus sp. SDR]|uniref:hypothetical protein n=1 Tax=Roseococcus sp. SDR TaxID=2835532 RepID=UPI001BCF52DA|nr:hypothetical protein [Roseococcus sp. SDR]MBS7792352.1 hypothetical protein [Roseococcus sp. SDR]MBV1847666.1 hypothetical protein [Roseococcus sp. SDR]
MSVWRIVIAAAASLPAAAQAVGPEQGHPHEQLSLGALARIAQNPLAKVYSVPFQNNTNLGTGPRKQTENILNIQPVLPFGLNDDWNLITRTVFPVTSQPGLSPGQGSSFGLGATQGSFFLSPARQTAGIGWGAGILVQAPTVTEPALGSRVWGAGPSGIALTMRGPWVVGTLLNNVWSFGGGPQDAYNTFTFQPLINYNFAHSPGTYLSTQPLITADWLAPPGQRWTVPVGLALGQVFRVHGQPMNANLGAYYNAIRPDNAPAWQVRAQLVFLFPR